MDKLIELLSRYGKDDDWCLVRVEWNVRKIDEMLIISKQYWFIKWLVDNDNINREEIKYSNLYIPLEKDFNKDDRLIMLLSISDTPIDDLISYLK